MPTGVLGFDWASPAGQVMEAIGETGVTAALLAVLALLLLFYKLTNGLRVPFRSVFFLMYAAYGVVVVLHLAGAIPLLFEVYRIVVRNYTTTQQGDGMIRLCRELHALAEMERVRVVFVLTLLYILLQSLCLPGSALINAAMGAVVGLPLGVPYCVVMGTIGASSCYAISDFIAGCYGGGGGGNRLVRKLRKQVEERTPSDLFAYFLLLRLTPVVPNWLLNMASPIAGVPLSIYAAGTFVGIIPQSYISVRFGEAALTTLSGEGVMMTPWDVMWIGVLCVVIIVGCILKRRYGKVDCGTEDKEQAAKKGK